MPVKHKSVKNDFGRLLKSMRTKSDTAWTQKSLAQELDEVSYRTYVGWENGEAIPSPEHLMQIVTLLKLSKEDEDALYQAAAQVPPITDNLPFQNLFFTGREEHLERLRKQLQETGTAAITQPISISGLGGVGKTQLALEYARRSYPNVYRAVFWVDAADRMMLQASYDSIAQLLKLPERNDRELDRRVEAVKQWLKRHTNWLLIMDNADDLALARSFLPSQPVGHVVLTTRSQITGTTATRAKQIEVEAMEPAEGLVLLLRRSKEVEDETKADIREAALKVVKLLGGLPLALDQAGAYIEETHVSFTDYVKRYQKERRYLLNRRRAPVRNYSDHPEFIEHPEPVAATLGLSAYPNNPAARRAIKPQAKWRNVR